MIYGIDDSYNNLLLRSISVSIHQMHLPFLVTEIFKSISQINPEFMWSFFMQKKLSYNLRKRRILNLPRAHSTYYSTNAVHLRGSLVWKNLPVKINPASSAYFCMPTVNKNLNNHIVMKAQHIMKQLHNIMEINLMKRT